MISAWCFVNIKERPIFSFRPPVSELEPLFLQEPISWHCPFSVFFCWTLLRRVRTGRGRVWEGGFFIYFFNPATFSGVRAFFWKNQSHDTVPLMNFSGRTWLGWVRSDRGREWEGFLFIYFFHPTTRLGVRATFLERINLMTLSL